MNFWIVSYSDDVQFSIGCVQIFDKKLQTSSKAGAASFICCKWHIWIDMTKDVESIIPLTGQLEPIYEHNFK